MERDQAREYQAIVWTDDPARPGERLTPLASNLEDAKTQIVDKYGSNITCSIWNEEDAAKPR
jgi:hypothetical protein